MDAPPVLGTVPVLLPPDSANSGIRRDVADTKLLRSGYHKSPASNCPPG